MGEYEGIGKRAEIDSIVDYFMDGACPEPAQEDTFHEKAERKCEELLDKIDQEYTGQDYQALGSVVDVLSPMIYPSHYKNGVYGLSVPDAQPYETILYALEASFQELEPVKEENRAIVRPWLQSFTATWVPGHITYRGEEIRKQIQAVYDAGYEEWILWNAANRYPKEGLIEEEETVSGQ